MRLKSLELQAFRSFGEKERVDFPSRGLMLLDGIDATTGESSGSGKSSLLEAVAFSIGYSQLPATELQCRHSKLPMQVTLTLDVDGEEVTLARGARTYYVKGGEKKTGAKEYADFVQRLFGMPGDLIRALTYRAQREVGKFVSMPDSEKKEFLGMCIPELESIEAAAEAARVRLSELQAKEKEIAYSVETGTVYVANEERELTATEKAKPANTEAFREEIQAARVELAKSENILRGTEHLASIAAQETGKKTAALAAEVDRLRGGVRMFGSCQPELDKISNRRKVLQAELDSLKADTCPTCGQDWERASARAENNRSEIKAIEEKIPLLEEGLRRLPGVEKMLAEREAEYYRETANPELARLKNELAIERSKLASKRSELDTKSYALKQIEASNAELERNVQVRRNAVKGLKEKLQEQSEALEAVRVKQAMEAAVHASLGRTGYMGSIFDEILSEISRETTAIVSGMPNTRSISMAFVSTQETKKGSTKRSIAPMIYKDGLAASLKSLSGGQQTTVELAADLAIGTVISRRTGRMPGWLALDEAFDGMGIPTKEICMEVLRKYAKDRLVLVVDHATEIKEAFDCQIIVEMNGGNSTVRRDG